MKYILYFLPFLFIGIATPTNAQSIHGNVAEATNFNGLDYANVEIYKNNELVASLITDELGNYNVALLDTGTYVVNVMYSGYETLVKELVVNGDEKADCQLKDDPTAKKRNRILVERLEEEKESTEVFMIDDSIYDMEAPMEMDSRFADKSFIREGLVKTEGSFAMAKSPSRHTDYGYEGIAEIDIPRQNAYAKGLTAGEINDFSKWDMWQDLKENDLAYFQKTWKFSPEGRYMVQVMNETKTPLVDAEVNLLDENEQIIWTSRTDNTGKAELWENISFPLDSTQNLAHRIKIDYRGITETIKRPKTFKKGLNSVILKADCESSNAVDIAFVVDATGSMQDEIDYLKLDINNVIYESKKMNDQLTMRFSSVFYRDYGEEYITKHQDFTKVLSSSSAYIEEQFAEGGGDRPEAVEDAMAVAIDTLSWSEEARARILFLVLDAPPHNNSKIQNKIKALSAKAAKKGIRIVPITGSGLDKSAEFLMRAMSLTSNGSYVFLTDHSGIGGGHIAPSTDEYEVQLLNDLLVNLIKSYTYVPSCEETIPEIDLFPELPDSTVSYINPLDSLLLIDPITGELDQTDVDHPADSLHADPVDSIDPTDPIDQPDPPIDPYEDVTWSYYPNPTFGPLTIEVSEAVDMLYLTDMSGKIIREIQMNGSQKVQTDLDGLPMGMYFLRYPIGKKWLTGKVVLMR